AAVAEDLGTGAGGVHGDDIVKLVALENRRPGEIDADAVGKVGFAKDDASVVLEPIDGVIVIAGVIAVIHENAVGAVDGDRSKQVGVKIPVADGDGLITGVGEELDRGALHVKRSAAAAVLDVDRRDRAEDVRLAVGDGAAI